MNKTDETRLFVAVPIPAALKRSAAEWTESLRHELPSFRKWVYPDDYHITLQFLGNVPQSRIQLLTEALKKAISPWREHGAPFELAIEGLGVFGRPKSPSILWAGVGGDTNQLHELHGIVTAALAPLGYKAEERAFNPHLTLARKYDGIAPFEAEQWVGHQSPAAASGEAQRFPVQELVLYASHLGRIPMYEPVVTIPL